MATPQQLVILQAPPRYTPGQDAQDYANAVNLWLANLYRYLTGVVYLRGNGLFFPPPALPTSGYGLYPGEVFSNGGVLTIVGIDDIWAAGGAISAAVGSVTVTV